MIESCSELDLDKKLHKLKWGRSARLVCWGFLCNRPFPRVCDRTPRERETWCLLPCSDFTVAPIDTVIESISGWKGLSQPARPAPSLREVQAEAQAGAEAETVEE